MDLHGWFRWQAQFDYMLRQRTPMKCVEVGVWLGCSALYTAERLKKWGGHLWCVDTWEGDAEFNEIKEVKEKLPTAYEQFVQNTLESGLTSWITPVKGDSVKVAETFEHAVDWIYIDGNHSFNAVYADLLGWWPHLNAGGIILGDDFGMDGVATAWNKFSGEIDKRVSFYDQLVWLTK